MKDGKEENKRCMAVIEYKSKIAMSLILTWVGMLSLAVIIESELLMGVLLLAIPLGITSAVYNYHKSTKIKNE